MEHEAHVFYAVSQFGADPCVVTQLAGFEPTEVWVVGQPMPQRPDVRYRHSRWTFKSRLPLNAPVEEHLNSLVSDLESHAAGVRAVSARFPANIGCAVYFHTYNPGLLLSQQLLARVAALGLDIDFDLYFLDRDDEIDEHLV